MTRKRTAWLIAGTATLIVGTLAELYAQPTLSTIADTVYNAVTGTPFSGQVSIQGPNVTQNGITVFGITRIVQIPNGAFSVALVPNDTASPGSSTYTMTFTAANYLDIKTCSVPTSILPLTLAQANCVNGTPSSPTAIPIPLSDLASGGASIGQVLAWGGTQWAPENLSGGGNVSNSGTPIIGQIPIWLGSTTIQGLAALSVNPSTGVFTEIDGIPTVGLGLPVVGWQSILANSSATSIATLASSLTAGDYEIHFGLDLHTPCASGSGALALQFAWTGNSARVLRTGSMFLGSQQQSSGFISGVQPIHVLSGNVTYTPIFVIPCSSGTAAWDGDIYLTRSN